MVSFIDFILDVSTQVFAMFLFFLAYLIVFSKPKGQLKKEEKTRATYLVFLIFFLLIILYLIASILDEIGL